ncbi:C39 family peptidase [Methanococcoides burtonii]|uniref:Peptidase C39-like domain-containing protein n=1 Tax=Methanococcoides burtonii (strain DSM 6242 / NBRC 107633 / OCM 468 / ACE-M) TaxID=259564 RepID=Q12YG6_METBU|nr:C39 family peptidase [Methanococcoides burtonii]ABE51510.1 Hypothetical protein Mbur_0532 [Methanococcoides burtonii DSM 6242]
MNRTNILSILLVLCIGIMLTANVSANQFEKTDNLDPFFVTIDSAELIASHYKQQIQTSVSDFSDWENAKIECSSTLYDLEGNPTVYAFEVSDKKQYMGYMLISASKRNYPILAFTKNEIPFENSEMKKKSIDSANQYMSKDTIEYESPKQLYLGGTYYLEEYDLKDRNGMTKNKIIVDLITGEAISSDELDLFSNENDESLQYSDKEEITVMWEELDAQISSSALNSYSYLTYSVMDHKIAGVPYYDYYLGCTPTAAANVLGYWEGGSYSSLPEGDTLISELATEMYTDSDGVTYTPLIDDGIEDVCSNHGYNNFDATNDYYLSWSEVKSEIDSSRPFMINMNSGGLASGRTQAYGQHSVACTGYLDSTTDYVILHDGWSGTDDHYLIFGNWGVAVATWVRP